MLPDTKYIVLIGHFGSGKTELALTLARHYAKEGGQTALVDLDIVNPYFRSSDHETLLIEEGVDVVSPSFAHSTVDVPALSADVHKVFDPQRYRHVIFDVGRRSGGARRRLGATIPISKRYAIRCVYYMWSIPCGR